MRPLYDLANAFAAQIHVAEQEAHRCYEPVIGLVTDNKDPDKLGRVKVKLAVLSDRETTHWCPILMPGAGTNRGWFFLPEIDDEVLCLFEHGDLDRPVVVGALWNGKDKPPDNNPGSNPRRMIKSRAGSKITFDDDEMKLVIEDGEGKGRITLDADGNKIIIEALEGDVCFQAPEGEVRIVAKSAKIQATSNVEVHAQNKMTWGSKANVNIQGNGGVTMSGAKVNIQCGSAEAPKAPEASPEDIADPYEARGG